MIRIALLAALVFPISANADYFDDYQRNVDLQRAISNLPLRQQRAVMDTFHDQMVAREQAQRRHDMESIIMAPFPGEER